MNIDKLRIEDYTDKYFTRSRKVLQYNMMNPIVRAQIFLRKPGIVNGIAETVNFIKMFCPSAKILAQKDFTPYESCVPVIVFEAPAVEIIELETVYLGIISTFTTEASTKTIMNLNTIASNTLDTISQIRDMIGSRGLMYMGARHIHHGWDATISEHAFRAGCTDCSTDVGSRRNNRLGVGTIPHALENIFAFYHGAENAVVNTTRAFNTWRKETGEKCNTVALVDYNNKEISDTLSTYSVLGDDLFGIRVDTCGENVMQGASTHKDIEFRNGEARFWVDGRKIHIKPENLKYWFGNGVTISGVYSLNNAVMHVESGPSRKLKFILSSGFGNPKKVAAFVEAEEQLQTQLFDTLGVGNIYNIPELRIATMDIVSVLDEDKWVNCSKIGRSHKQNPGLAQV